ncbi:MAG: hypothetical protein ACJ71S_09235 [Acidobacteriaceae bacterium]
MAEQEVIQLLEQIRDLQKQHVENYKDALKNQEASLVLQRAAVRRQRIMLFVLASFLIAVLAFLLYSEKH